jgi:hypothetical protein
MVMTDTHKQEGPSGRDGGDRSKPLVHPIIDRTHSPDLFILANARPPGTVAGRHFVTPLPTTPRRDGLRPRPATGTGHPLHP